MSKLRELEIDRILNIDNEIFIYKLSPKIVKKMYKLLLNQTDNHIDTWGNRYNLKECTERIKLSESDQILLAGIFTIDNYNTDNINQNINTKLVYYQKNKNEIVKMIGLVGYNYNQEYFVKEVSNNYFTHVLIDMKYLKKKIATRSMNLLLDYIKSNNFPKDKIYATVYSDNESSINLHLKLGFQEVITYHDVKVFEFKLNTHSD